MGAPLLDRIIDLTQYSVFSPRTVALMRMDAFRLRARLSQPREKVSPKERRLHIGCGKRVVAGWLNVDVAGTEPCVDLASGSLPWPDGVFTAIVGQHVIEHLELFDEALPLLRELKRVSAAGCEIWLSCPDLATVCKSYVDEKGTGLLEDFIARFPKLDEWRPIPMHIVNAMFDQGGEHKNLFDFELLQWALGKAGFVDCKHVQERDLLDRFPGFPPRNDDYHTLYVRAVAN